MDFTRGAGGAAGAGGPVHVLLVGIDAYPEGVAPLRGCRNDIRAARRWLGRRAGGELSVLELADAEATVAAVTAGITGHLGGARPGGTALLWFSGHGTTLTARPHELLIEATGRCQALLCHDGPLIDKDLGRLLGEISARGVHTAAVLDCCYSGGATRDPELAARWAPPQPDWHRLAAASRDAAATAPGAPPPVLLAACRLDEQAYEVDLPGQAEGDGDAGGGVGAGGWDAGTAGAPGTAGAWDTAGAPDVAGAPDAAGVAGTAGAWDTADVADAGSVPHTAGAWDLAGAPGSPAPGPGLAGASGPPAGRQGLFTRSLLAAADDCGEGATYRDLLAAAHGRVQAVSSYQHPTLWPPFAPGPADRPVLGGALRAPGPALLRHGRQGWEVDQGSAHGLGDGPSAAATRFTVTGTAAGADGPRVVHARSVRAERTLVDAHGWEPDPRKVYPVEVSALALPPAWVTVDDARARAWLADALAHAGPGGGPAPLVRLGPPAAAPGFRVAVRGGTATVSFRDGTATVPPLPLAGPRDAPGVVRCLAHLARWHRLRDLAHPSSALNSLVRVEVTAWDRTTPPRRDGGELVFRYGDGGRSPREPLLSIRIRNRSTTRRLWCVLLDLTDSYAAHSVLFPGDFIGPGHTGHALDGEPVRLSLPPGRAVRPGAEVRDWLKLIVSTTEVNTVPFHLPPWRVDESAAADGFGRGGGPDGFSGVLDFGPAPGGRDIGPAPQSDTSAWGVLTVPLRTVVP